MTEELEVLKTVSERLNKANMPYMVCGSIAANYYSVPRMTRDIDIVIELTQDDTDRFVRLFEDDFYVSRKAVENEISREGLFNLIHNQYIIKIDFILKKSSAYQQVAFSRRKEILIEGSPMWFISAEDLVISKLLWAKESHSEVQLKDVGNLVETADNLDLNYIDNWVRELRLEQVYKEANDVRHTS